VGECTLGALLTPDALERRAAGVHRFCPAPDCRVVYFGGRDVYGVGDLMVPVFQKTPAGSRTVCYCFDVHEETLRQEAARGEAGASLRRIRALVQQKLCACELRNPQGSCCLGHLARRMHDLEDGSHDAIACAPSGC
jgi:hypothetical protein